MQRSLSLNKAMLRQILILRRFVRYFFVQGKLHKKCHSFPSHLSLYFIKYAPSILFLKILKYYNSTILYKSPKNPIFVQLSPIQCTYSNIFIRFFKFFTANTNIYQNSYSLQCGHLISFGTKYFVIASGKSGTPRDTFVPVGKRSMQA